MKWQKERLLCNQKNQSRSERPMPQGDLKLLPVLLTYVAYLQCLIIWNLWGLKGGIYFPQKSIFWNIFFLSHPTL